MELGESAIQSTKPSPNNVQSKAWAQGEAEFADSRSRPIGYLHNAIVLGCALVGSMLLYRTIRRQVGNQQAPEA